MSKQPRTLRDIGYKQCRWVIGDDKGIETLFCADQTNEGSSYCNKHYQVVYGHGNGNAYDEKEIDYLLWLWDKHSPSMWLPDDDDDKYEVNEVVNFYRGLCDRHD